MKLQGWRLNIVYRADGSNANADALSRQEWTETSGDEPHLNKRRCGDHGNRHSCVV